MIVIAVTPSFCPDRMLFVERHDSAISAFTGTPLGPKMDREDPP
ncbi:hypothetical protein ACP6EK_02350 [Candidatus Caldatribacterium sp. SIUC1]